jgi:hypothetical protein
MNLKRFCVGLVDEQMEFPVIFPVSREFATRAFLFGREKRTCGKPLVKAAEPARKRHQQDGRL